MLEKYGVVWSPQAVQDIERLHGQIAPHDPDAADRYLSQVLESVELLRVHPRSAPALSEVPLDGEFRSLVMRNHRIVYRVGAAQLRIYGVWDGRQDPAGFWQSVEAAE